MCELGFAGPACEKTHCPMGCSGNGICRSIEAIGRDHSTKSSFGFGKRYLGWDRHSSYGCICDWGYSGPACHERICPKGDDLLTTGQNYRVVTVTTDTLLGSSAMYGQFGLEIVMFSMTDVRFDARLPCESDMAFMPENISRVHRIFTTSFGKAGV